MSAECNRCGFDLVRTIKSDFHCMYCENNRLEAVLEQTQNALKSSEADRLKLEARVADLLGAYNFCGYADDYGDSKLGCGEKFTWIGGIYKCLDCEVRFCKKCLKKHCEHEWENLRAKLAAAEAMAERLAVQLRNVINTGCFVDDCDEALVEYSAWKAGAK